MRYRIRRKFLQSTEKNEKNDIAMQQKRLNVPCRTFYGLNRNYQKGALKICNNQIQQTERTCA